MVRNALIVAYGDELRAIMGAARGKRISLFGGDPAEVASLFPELDIEVNMSSASVVDNAELRLMRNDGIITQEGMAKRMGKNTNIPEEELVTLPWPDGIDRSVEMPGGPKPPKPQPKATAAKKAKK